MKNIQKYIEHTNLKPTMTHLDVEQLINEAKEHNLLGVCLPPFWVKKAKRDIENSEIQLITVIGFPLGYQATESKLTEIQKAIDDGVDELDMVLNVSALKAQMNWPKVEIAKCSKLAHENFKILKVIIETAYLSEQELEIACRWCADAGVDYVKTSTGFAPSGAKVADIVKMRSILPSNVGIKASGGIKTYEQATTLIKAGADRIGTSSGMSIAQYR